MVKGVLGLRFGLCFLSVHLSGPKGGGFSVPFSEKNKSANEICILIRSATIRHDENEQRMVGGKGEGAGILFKKVGRCCSVSV